MLSSGLKQRSQHPIVDSIGKGLFPIELLIHFSIYAQPGLAAGRDTATVLCLT